VQICIISHITRVLLCAHSRFLLWWMNIAIDHMGEDGRRGRRKGEEGEMGACHSFHLEVSDPASGGYSLPQLFEAYSILLY